MWKKRTAREQWHDAIHNVIVTTSPVQLWKLLAMVLSMSHPADPAYLWLTYRDARAEDYLLQYHQHMMNMNLPYQDRIYHMALIDLENNTYNLANQPLEGYGLQSPKRSVEEELHTDIIACDDICEYVTDKEALFL